MKQYLQYLIPVLAILFLTGFFDNLANGHLFVTVVIGSVYFLGFFALYIMSESPYKKGKHHLLLASYIALFIAYFALEALFKEMYGA